MAPLDPHGAAQWLADVGAPFAGVLLALYLDGSALPEFVKARGRRGRSVDTAKGGGSARARNRKRRRAILCTAPHAPQIHQTGELGDMNPLPYVAM